MNHVIKTNITLHLFNPHNTDEPSGYFKRALVSVISAAGSSRYCVPRNISVVFCGNFLFFSASTVF